MPFVNVSVSVGGATEAQNANDLDGNTDFNRGLADVDHDFDITTGDGTHNPGLLWRSGTVHPTNESASYTTLQDADDDLDSGPYVLQVQQATYAAGLTVSTNEAKIILAPGTIVQAAIILSGDDITLVLGAGCDIQALVTLSGTGCTLICENGCDLDGLLVSGVDCLVNGGGWETLSNGGVARHAISIVASRAIVGNISVQTTTGGGQPNDGVNLSGDADDCRLEAIRVIDSDRAGFTVNTGATKNDLIGCRVENSDNEGFVLNGESTVAEDCYTANASGGDGFSVNLDSFMQIRNCEIFNPGRYGIFLGAPDFVCVGNLIRTTPDDGINIAAAGDDGVVVGNRIKAWTNEAIDDDSGGTCTIASNEITV